MSFNTNRWSCYRWRHAVNSAKNFLGKIFLIIWVFVGETRLPLYPSWCQISHLTKTETEPQISNPSLGFTLAEPQTGIIVKSWFGVLSQSFPSSGWRKQSFWEGKRQKFELKLFLLGHDLYKRYILQKTGSKTAICVLRTGLSNLNPLMWGSHGQLDDWPTKTQMTIGDHLVGWATNRTYTPFTCLLSSPNTARSVHRPSPCVQKQVIVGDRWAGRSPLIPDDDLY